MFNRYVRDIWWMFGYFKDGHVNVKGSFLPSEEATRADSSGTKFEAAQAEWLRSWTYANLSWRKLQDVPSWKEQKPRSVFWVFVLNMRSTFKHFMVIHVYFVWLLIPPHNYRLSTQNSPSPSIGLYILDLIGNLFTMFYGASCGSLHPIQ